MVSVVVFSWGNNLSVHGVVAHNIHQGSSSYSSAYSYQYSCKLSKGPFKAGTLLGMTDGSELILDGYLDGRLLAGDAGGFCLAAI